MPWNVRSEALKPNQLAPVNHIVRPSRSTRRLPSVCSQSPAPLVLDAELEELLEDEELLLEDEELEDELELEELLLEDELELLELEELLDEELELEELELVRPLIEPADAVSVTRSIRAPSSRRTIRSVCVPAARLLNIARLRVE
jgi:hypothetical protein